MPNYDSNSYPRESQLEKFIKDLVYHNTAEEVDLHLKDQIVIKHINRKGSIVLGIFWSNVLQCDRNFPPYPYMYKKNFDDQLNEEKLMLTVDDVTFSVYLTTGTFTICGEYIYEWFTKFFRGILNNFDLQFGENWQYEATAVKIFPPTDDKCELNDPNSETENYLLMQNTVQPMYSDVERRLQEGNEDLVKGVGNLNMDHELFTDEELETELKNISQGGVKDGLGVVYKIWKSLLNKWFAVQGTQVFMSSPELDTERLKDIIELYLKYRTLGDMNVFYVNQNCDPGNGKSVVKVKKEATAKLNGELKTFVEYRILRKMIHPTNPTHAKFIAGVRDGKAEVLVTSASFHGSHFVSGSSEMVLYLKMDEEFFMKNYIEIIAAPNATVSY